MSNSSRIEAARELLAHDRSEDAELELKAVLREEPKNEQALILMGGVYLRLGKIPQSERSLYEVLRANPKSVEAIWLLGLLRKAQKNFQGAIDQFSRCNQLGRDSAELENELGLCWQEMGDTARAVECFRSAVELDPTSARMFFNLGKALKSRKELGEAFSAIKRSAELDPTLLDSYVEISDLMRSLFNFEESLAVLEMGLRSHPESIVLMVAVAATYRKVGRSEDAEKLFQKAFARDPDAGAAYAYWLQEEGRFADSIEILERWVKAKPVQGHAYYLLANEGRYEIDGSPLTELAEPLLQNRWISGASRMYLAYALAKTYDHLKSYELAMKFYDMANGLAFKIHNSRITLSPSLTDKSLAVQREVFSEKAIREGRRLGSRSETPLFIVGMIRSGTTLLDQILSSHPQVTSAGEQPFWTMKGPKVTHKWRRSGVQADDVRRLGESYLQALRSAAGESHRITDKMPTNYEHLGLLSIVFPKAKFIHLRRSPLDTTLSIYTTYFGKGTDMAYNRNHIVTAYRGYLRAMEYWRTVLPADQMIEIDYEDLVADKENVLREVLEFCALPWDDSVLTHEENPAAVSTPSYWTARQPVNTRSVERWRRYEPWLGELKGLLDAKHPPRTRFTIT